jgi:excisionase family DNA binding protein
MPRTSVTRELREIKTLVQLGEDTILTFPEAAEFLHLSKGALYRLTSARKVPASKPGGKKLYFSKRELSRWLMGSPLQEAR